MIILIFVLFLSFLPLSSAQSDPLNEDTFFQDVTTQAWRKYDESQKRRLKMGSVEIENPAEAETAFQRGLRYQSQRNWKKAAKAYHQAISQFPPYPISAEALWQLGHCYEELNRWIDAFEAYERLYTKYPAFDFSDEALQRQFKMAQILAEGKERTVLKYATDRLYIDIAADLLRQLQRQVPQTDLAAKCQFELGKIKKKSKQYKEASENFYAVVLNYPNHPLVKDALFESGVSASRVIKGASYDSKRINEVLQRLTKFIEDYPEDNRVKVAQAICAEMGELKAEKLFHTGNFYQKTGNMNAAQIYYNELLTDFPESFWAKKIQSQTKIEN